MDIILPPAAITHPLPCGVPYPTQESKGAVTFLGLGQWRRRRDPPRLCLWERPSVTGFVAGPHGLVPLFPGTVARNWPESMVHEGLCTFACLMLLLFFDSVLLYVFLRRNSWFL